jgi:hypothetical protein
MKFISSAWNFLMICAEELEKYRNGKYSKVK